MMVAATTVLNPAPGPDTSNCEPLIRVVTKPPIIPVINPAYNGAPLASAMPMHNGSATKNTDSPAGKS